MPALPVKSYRFHAGHTFNEVRAMLAEISDTAHQHLVARLVWREGSAAGRELSFLWDAKAGRFGHELDKSTLDRAVVDNLINDLSVEVKLIEPHPLPRKAQS